MSIPYDDLEDNPKLIRFLLKALLAPYITTEGNSKYSLVEREVMKFAMLAGRPIRPIEIVRELSVNKRTAVKVLAQLCGEGKLRPIVRGTSGRITRYEWIRSFEDEAVW